VRHRIDDQRRGGGQRDDHDQRSQVDLHRATLQCVLKSPSQERMAAGRRGGIAICETGFRVRLSG
jgi:hypothetical protein